MVILRAQVALFALLIGGPAVAFLGQVREPQPHTFLRQHLSFSASELARLEAGEIMVKLPRTDETREVASFGIMRLDVPADFLIDKKRDIVNFKKSENVLQVGKFSNPPRLEDLSDLVIDSTDIESLRRCNVNSCDLKLSAASIERFRHQIDWTAPDYRERAARLLREMLLEYVHAYLKEGITALGEYNDKSRPLSRSDELLSLMQPQSYLYPYEREFQRHLQEFPNFRMAGAEDFIYWSKEKFGPKPVLSLTHVTIYRKQESSQTTVLFASKGIYASHYLEASVGISTFIQSEDPFRSYLIYVNRSQVDALRGFLGGLKRSLMMGKVRDGMKRNMEVIRQRLESEYRKHVTAHSRE